MSGNRSTVSLTDVTQRLVFAVRGLCLLLFLALLVMPFDVLISRHTFLRWLGQPTLLRSMLDRSEPFGHGIGIAWIIIAIYLLDPSRRKACLSLTTTALCAGGTANLVKLIIRRSRPREFDFHSSTNSLFAGFQNWLPEFSLKSGGHSFPSAHTATAVGVAVFLSAMYPRGRWLFAVLAMIVGFQRLHGGAHFPSDILVGAALGFFVGQVCIGLARHYRYLPQSDPSRS